MQLEYFQMVDSVVDINSAQLSIHAKANVPDNSTIFDGHFPTMPLLPGVLMIETMAQTSGYMLLWQNKNKFMPFLVGVKEAKFRKFVAPKTTLDIFAKIIHEGSGFAVAQAEIKNLGEKICSSTLTFKLAEFENDEFKNIITNRLKEIGLHNE